MKLMSIMILAGLSAPAFAGECAGREFEYVAPDRSKKIVCHEAVTPSATPMVVSIPAGPVGKSVGTAARVLNFSYYMQLDKGRANPATKALRMRCAATPCTTEETHAIVAKLLQGALVEYRWREPLSLDVFIMPWCQPELSSNAPLPPCIEKPQRMAP